MVNKACDAINTWNKDEAKIVIEIENSVDEMEEVYRKRHIIRINKGICTVSDLDYYVEILSNLERIGDHADNIANNVVNDEFAENPITGLKEISL